MTLMVENWRFWVLALALSLVVGLVLTRALSGDQAGMAPTPARKDLAVYRDQLREIARDIARGTLAPDEGERARIEVSRRLLAADAQGPAPLVLPSALTGRLSLLPGLLAPLAALALYASLGAPGLGDLPIARRLALADQAYADRPSQAEAEALAPQLDPGPAVEPKLMALIEELRAAVAKRPGDLTGLGYLVKYEGLLGNFAAAARAQAQIIAVKGAAATAEDHAQLAEVMILAAGGRISPEAEAELVRALELDPGHGPARYYLGLMALQVGRPDRAFALWQSLLAEGPADAPWIPPISEQIEAVAAAAGLRYAPPAQPGPDAADLAAAEQMSPEERQAMIAAMVEGLETRLLAAGGPLADWVRLIEALGVLGQTGRAEAAYGQAKAAFAAEPGALAALQAAATQAGIAP